MTLFVLTLAGCMYSTSSSVVVDPDDERANLLKCEGGDLDACYELRGSEDRNRRILGLNRGCDAGFRDTCSLLYEFVKDGTELGDATFAFGAAQRGCANGDPALCQAALDFAETHPNYEEVVEKHRAELEALLAEHSE